jgi:hypothetical protein
VTITLKILITLTFLFYLLKSWAKAFAVATISVLAKDASPAARKKVGDATGKATVKAFGTLFWMAPLTALTWIFL